MKRETIRDMLKESQSEGRKDKESKNQKEDRQQERKEEGEHIRVHVIDGKYLTFSQCIRSP